MKRTFIFLVYIILNSCSNTGQQEDLCTPTPILNITEINNITNSTVKISAKITPPTCDTSVTKQGFVLSENLLPTTEDNVVEINGENISNTFTNLNSNQKYYVRAFFTNTVGTFYSDQIEFKTLIGITNIYTYNISSISINTAKSGGNISDDGNSDIIAKGVCWNTSPNPTTDNYKTMDGSGLGPFDSNLESLNLNSTYYVRAYATNEAGTTYGDEKIFTTRDGVVNITTSEIENIQAFSADSGGNVIDDGGSNIIAKGVCWNTSPNPTTDNYKTVDGSGLGSFESNIENLNLYTTYYVRAYATNGVNTFYGEGKTFKTQGVFEAQTSEVTEITATNAYCGQSVAFDLNGMSRDEVGIIWNNTDVVDLSNYLGKASYKYNGVGGSSIRYFKLNDLQPNTEYYVRAFATATSGSTGYGEIKSFRTNEFSLIDIDGNIYKTVKYESDDYISYNGQYYLINEEISMENLRVKHYKNGDPILHAQTDNEWIQAWQSGVGAWCYYGDEDEHGLLYNGFAVGDPRGLAPEGWHVPTNDDFYRILQKTGKTNIGATSWSFINENYGGTNEDLFDSRLSGYREIYNPNLNQTLIRFVGFGIVDKFWTSTTRFGGTVDTDETQIITYKIDTNPSEITSESLRYSRDGFSIRVVKD